MVSFGRQSLHRFGKRGLVTGATLGLTALGVPLPVLYAKEESTPPFSLTASKLDQSSYLGRLYTVFDKIDPRTLLTTDSEVKRCQNLLEEYRTTQRIPHGKTDADMWDARKTVEAVIHPVTNTPMFPLGRMSAFVPMNVPICAIMLNSHTTLAIVFSQWLNQTYNVLNNYVNRSSLEVDWAELATPYGIAVTVSCGIALGARQALQAMPALAKLGLCVPYFAVISAGSCNVAFTRMDEWNGRGVCIFSPEGKELGMSLKAGQQAVIKTIATRSVCLPIPLLIVPPLVMSCLPFAGASAMFAELIVITACISCALPCALAILPQEMELSTDVLEAEYQNLLDSHGRSIATVFANKGL